MVAAGTVVEQLGGHPSRALGLDLANDSGRFRWLVAACLLSVRGAEERASTAYRGLEARGLLEPGALGEADPLQLARLFAEAGLPRPERPAALLVRLGRRLADDGPDALDRLADGADDLEGLGGALVGLASGLGPATALRFLRPLRDHWPAAREVPLDEPARAAARHLGWLPDDDLEASRDVLEVALRGEASPPDAADLEAALERLGRRACLSGRVARCPLAGLCPMR